MIRPDFTAQERRKLEIAAGIVSSYFPSLGGVYAKLDIRLDDRIDTMGVTESGKLLVNRKFFAELAPGVETAFLLAHETLHLAQMIFERGKAFYDHEALNIAHDILINEFLCAETGVEKPPKSGLSWAWFKGQCSGSGKKLPKFRDNVFDYSLEEMVRLVVAAKDAAPPADVRSWRFGGGEDGGGFSNNPFGDFFGRSVALPLDMIPEEMEAKLFPDEDREERRKADKEMRDACCSAAAENALLNSLNRSNNRGTSPGNAEEGIDVVRSFYAPPWQMAMQRWFDGVAVPKRSYARASRRGAWRSDVVLPGRDQDRFILHLVLDTSGSMSDVIPTLLGQIAAFARNAGMAQVHILQCDTEVTADEYVDIGSLDKYRISGYGGSDMSPAMLKLAEDSDVSSAVVITDGDIKYPPADKIPYGVLWCIPGEASPVRFDYGKIINVPLGMKESG